MTRQSLRESRPFNAKVQKKQMRNTGHSRKTRRKMNALKWLELGVEQQENDKAA